MILFENIIARLDYSPATDIAVLEYPDLHGFLIPEIKHSIDLLVDIIRNYDIKRLLLDSTGTVATASEEEGRELAIYLTSGIARTRVQKVARLRSSAQDLEAREKSHVAYILKSLAIPFQLQNFTDKAVAVEWLKALS